MHSSPSQVPFFIAGVQIRNAYLMALSGLMTATGERVSPPVMVTVGEALRSSARIAGTVQAVHARIIQKQALHSTGAVSMCCRHLTGAVTCAYLKLKTRLCLCQQAQVEAFGC
eukprot:1141022-Pelagomonas_calceolata.AAC.2